MRDLIKTEKLQLAAVKFTQWFGTIQSLFIHTLFFISFFVLYFFGWTISEILMDLTLILSLEAIYLSIFILMGVNLQNKNIDEMKENVDEMKENVEEIQEDMEELQEDVEEIQEDVEEIQEDMEEIQEDMEEIQENVEDLQEDDEGELLLTKIEETMKSLISEMIELKKLQKKKNQ